MSGTRSADRMRRLCRLATHRERTAARRLGRVRRERESARARLRELEQYREEYLARYAREASGGASPARLVDFQQFIRRLDAAIAEQRRVLEGLEGQCESARRQWDLRHVETRALDRVAERRSEDARREAERQEQRLLDDRVPRRS